MSPIICVGAVYIDTILTVPHFPGEDKKLRASSKTCRRGGNCGNTLEVLEQLIKLSSCKNTNPNSDQGQLYLIAVLPGDNYQFILDSFSTTILRQTCIFRPESHEAASSYIIRSQETGSRTIVSYNELKEMTVDEFVTSAESVLAHVQEGWFHFEGRIPDVTLSCVQFLRRDPRFKNFKISVELEKPDRTGLTFVAEEADVVFYSRIWAEYRGFTSAADFLESQIPHTRPSAVLCCTWGSHGPTVVQKYKQDGHPKTSWSSIKAWNPNPNPEEKTKSQVVDSIGAGDTFIAGMLFGLAYHDQDWSLETKLRVANELAGRKVFREGFKLLAEDFVRGPGASKNVVL